MFKKWGMGLGLVLALARTTIGTAAFAEEVINSETVGGVTTGFNTSTGRPLSEIIGVSAESRFYGPSFGNPSALRPNLNTGDLDPKSALKTEDKVSFYYKIDANHQIGMSAEADFYPVLDHQFVAKDPSLVYKASGLFKGRIFQWDTLIRGYLPLSTTSQTNHQVLAVRLETTPKWNIPNSRFAFSAYNYVNHLFYSRDTAGLKDWKFNFIPEMSYRVSPKVLLLLDYKMWAYHLAGKSLGNMDNDVTYLSPGLSWTPIPNLNINPYIDFSTGTKVSWNTTTLGVYLWWGLI